MEFQRDKSEDPPRFCSYAENPICCASAYYAKMDLLRTRYTSAINNMLDTIEDMQKVHNRI